MSHASAAHLATRRRPSRARRAALVLAAVVALGACSHNRTIPERYGDGTEDNFIEGCEAALTARDGEGERLEADDARAVCRCSYEGISDPETGIPFEEFKQVNEDQESEPEALPSEMRTIIEDCRSEAGLS